MLRRWALGYVDLILLALAVLYILASNLPFVTLPGMAARAPLGILGLGVVAAVPIALQAVGMVLVLRSNRIINFAQVAVGGFAGFLFYELIHHVQFVALLKQFCTVCVPGVSSDATFNQSHGVQFARALVSSHHTGLLAANFWISAVLAFIVAPVLAYLVYVAIIARFNSAPRLIVTVGTIAVAQLLGALIPMIRSSVFLDQRTDLPGIGYLPFGDLKFELKPTIFHTPDVILVVGAGIALMALGAFLFFSSTGIAIRAASENPQRASTLGISVTTLSGIVWFLAGVLSGAAAMFAVLKDPTGSAGIAGIDAGGLVPILVAVVFARMTSVPLTIGAALALGIIDRAMFWNISSSVPFQGALVLMITASLLLQRNRLSRAEQDAAADYLAAREARPIPRELRHVGVVDSTIRWLSLLLVVLVLGFPFAMSPGQVSLGSVVIVYAIVGLSLLVLTGWAGQISLGQFAFAAVGAYVAALLRGRFGLDVTICLFAGGLGGALVAVLVGIPALRLKGLHLAITTLAFALAVSQILLAPNYLGQYLPSTLNRPFYLGFNMDDEKVYFYYSLAFLLLAVGVVMGLRQSRTARALIAARDNEGAAQAFGINLLTARLSAFAISGFMAAFAGALFAFHEHGIEPVAFSADESIRMFLMVVIGGLGSIAGPLLGALYEGALLIIGDPTIAFFGTGAGVLVILLLLQGGLAAGAYKVRDSWLRRVATRRRIFVPIFATEVRANGLEDRPGMTPKTLPGGRTAFIPVRYRLGGQWHGFKEPRDG